MPAKKKKKKRERTVQQIECDLDFDDTTMLEANGRYKDVKRLMGKATNFVHSPGGKAFLTVTPNYADWVVKTRLSIFSPFGQGNFVLDFYHDGRVYIVGFATTTPDRYQNPDVRCLTMWCQENGWKIPQVAESVIRDNVDFWRHMWETLIIDSDYLDERFGKRRALGVREIAEEENDDETDEDI